MEQKVKLPVIAISTDKEFYLVEGFPRKIYSVKHKRFLADVPFDDPAYKEGIKWEPVKNSSNAME